MDSAMQTQTGSPMTGVLSEVAATMSSVLQLSMICEVC